jgi:BolA family transcriptional regulator, general stress-responsive regulator
VSPRAQLIEQRVRAALEVEAIEVADDSHLHAGHAGAAAGGGHFRVMVVSPDFAGHRTMQRHRMVYEAVGDAMRNDVIHALSIKALTPEEYQAQ